VKFDSDKSFTARGFTLVELLVALVLGLLLTGGIVNIYLQNKQNYLQDEEIARLQENARYALNMLKRELTMAGFVGNLPDPEDVPVGDLTSLGTGGSDCVTGSNWALDVQGDVFELINNVDNTATSLDTINGTTWTCIAISDVEDTTDMVSIKRTADDYTLEDGSFPAGVTEDEEQVYLRSFDDDADLSWVYLGSGGSIASADATAGSSVDYWEYYSKIFYIRNNCLVEGIEDMQIEVGIDTDDDSVPNQFEDSPTAAQLADAVAVRIYLLVRSVNDISGYTNEKTYTLGSKAVGAQNDGFIRRVFTTTVQMRNAKLPNA